MAKRHLVEAKRNHEQIQRLFSRSKVCPCCGKQMDINMLYKDRPHLVGLQSNPSLVCGSCYRDGSYSDPQIVGASWFHEY